MKSLAWMLGGIGLLLPLLTTPAQADPRISVGFSFGVPYHRLHCRPRPCWSPRPYYFRYPRTYSYIYYERPVVVPPPRVVVQERYVPVRDTTPPPTVPVPTAPPLQPITVNSPPPTRTPVVSGVIDNLRLLNDPDETIRSQAVIELGRMKARRAVDPLNATLAGDQSPLVRESAARALGLIGSPQALTALKYASEADPVQEVRNSAQLAMNIILATQEK